MFRKGSEQNAHDRRGFSLFPQKRARVVSAVVLTQRVYLFRGRLVLRLPPDFRMRSRSKDGEQYLGRRSGMLLDVMQVPFTRSVRHLTALDLSIAFRRMIPVRLVPEIHYGFLRRSPTVTAVWTEPNSKKTVLHLIQVRQTVFVLLFDCMLPGSENAAEAIIAAENVVC